MKNFILSLVVLLSTTLCAQSVGINSSGQFPAALLDIKPNGTHKTVTMPSVSLASITDKTSINGGAPTESLLIYNSNENIPGGKGLFYWSEELQEWQFLVSQANINLFRNLTRYYTAKTANALSISSTPSTGSLVYTIGSSTTTGWNMIKSSGTTDLALDIQVDQPENFVEINLTGTTIISNTSNLNNSVDFAYGIFVDNVLQYVKTDTTTQLNSCNYDNFYINAVIPNIPTGAHRVTFGVILRRTRNQSTSTNNSLPNGTSISIGGGNSNCNSLNSFESETRATLFLNQTL